MQDLLPELDQLASADAGREGNALWRQVQSRDVQVANAIVSAEIARHSLRLVDPRAPFSFRYGTTKFSTTTLSDFTYLGAPSSVDLPLEERDCYLLIIPVTGYTVARYDGMAARLEPGHAMLFGPQGRLSFRNSANWRNLDIRISRQRLEEFVRLHVRSVLRDPMAFEHRPFALRGEGGPLLRFVRYLLRETTSIDSALRRAATAEGLERTLYSIIIDTVPNTLTRPLRYETGLQHVPRSVVLAERFMSERAREPLTLSQIAAASERRPRSLHKAFRKYRGYTPLEFLRDCRLDLARAALTSRQRPATSVTATALASGFTHLGKFAASYRRRFGENPSTTLRRG